LTWWLANELFAGQNVIANIRIWTACLMKVVGICLRFPTKQEWAHLDF
jgi:hypothetical protein